MAKREKDGLNDQRKKFAQEYIKDYNGTQAAIRAGYAEDSAHVQASRLLSNDKVSGYIKELISDIRIMDHISASRLVEELAYQAFADTESYYDDEGALKPLSELTREQRAAIKSIETIEFKGGKDQRATSTSKKLVLYDKQKASEQMAKIMNYVNQDQDTGTRVYNINRQIITKLGK